MTASAGGDGYGSMISSIFAGVSQAIEDINGQSRENIRVAAEDPCYAEIELVAWRRNALDVAVNNTISSVNGAARAGRESVISAKLNWGRGGQHAGYLDASVTPFAEWLIDAGIIPYSAIVGFGALWGGGPLSALAAGLAAESWVQDRLPPQGQAPSRKNRGVKLAPGAYLYAGPGRTDAYHAINGTWTGSRVRRSYESWLDHIRDRAVPAGYNRWRNALVRLVGRSRDDWTVWREGDPIHPLSRIGFLLQRRNEVGDQAAEYARLCAIKRDQANTAITTTLETERLKALAPYAVGGVLALAWAIGKRR